MSHLNLSRLSARLATSGIRKLEQLAKDTPVSFR
jgi:hypothetical protein